MNKLIAILALLLCLPVFAQRDTLLGRVMAGGGEAPGVFVINKNTGIEVKSNSRGLFKIAVRNGDRLVVYSTRTEVREFIAGKEWFAAMPYELEVEPKAEQLDAVVIDKSITPENLGLVPENQKRYTVAERRLKTAGEFKPTLLFFLGGGVAFPLDPILNAISGRTKMLKKELATERKQMGMESIGNIYTDEQITTELQIPAEKVQAFMFYAVENPELMQAIKDKNNARAKLELQVLAGRYLEMQGDSLQSQLPPQQSSDFGHPTSDPNPHPTTDTPQQQKTSQNEN